MDASPKIAIRAAEIHDLPDITELYNHYVLNTPITFDLDPYTPEGRAPWFRQFATTGPYRLLVAERQAELLGYAGTTRFRPKAAYDTTVETTIYLSPKATGCGIGTKLYDALFTAIAHEDIHRILAGYTLPNPASAALHARCGFVLTGVFSEVGRKFGRYWNVAWLERPLPLPGSGTPHPASSNKTI